MEYKCPKCQSLIYSRRHKLCGRCGEPLPPEFLLTADQIEALDHGRESARKLADKFDPWGATGYDETLPVPKNFSEEFRHRKRTPGLWISAIGHSFVVVMVVVLSFVLGKVPISLVLFLVVYLAISGVTVWNTAAPICPGCHQNIRICPPEYCHRCGRRLRNKRCNDCSVDYTWTALFRPFNRNRSLYIKFCPGCGVELDTWVTRWLDPRT